MIPEHVKKAFDESAKYFPTPIQQVQYTDKYARFNYDLGRRETWVETVRRAVAYLKELSGNKLPQTEYDKIQQYILEMKVAPSMRLLAMAGESARRQNISIYNCSYTPIDSIDALVEILIIGMAGCGTGWSVEQKYTNQLPKIAYQFNLIESYFEQIVIEDTTEGWAEAFRKGIRTWIDGYDVNFDYSQIREAGAPLRTKGGTASGPAPLKRLMEFTRDIILSAQGRKLTTLEVHLIACKVAESIVSGGVRRVACISLFDYDDELMRNCKNGENIQPELWMSNNSAVWPDDITDEQVTDQMQDMFNGMRGEPGIFSRANANKLAPFRRQKFGRKEFGTNPCGEITLRPYQFCNLSQVLVRADDTRETLLDKIEVATIIGTIQSMATHFPGLRPIWQKNCEEERLLGVDLDGELDNVLTQPSNPKRWELFEALRNHSIKTNATYAELLTINPSASITCIKPNGNAGVLYNCASGLHPRWAKYYIRNMRLQAQSPLAQLLLSQKIPMDPENGQTWENATAYVVHFPIKAPENALTRHDLTAIQQCENWLENKIYYTEHNPSVTISYKEEEKAELLEWILQNKEYIGGMSFLPTIEAKYRQMPNQQITQEEYEKLIKEFPIIDLSQIVNFESSDLTTASQELACVSGACSLEDYQALKAAKESNLLIV